MLSLTSVALVAVLNTTVTTAPHFDSEGCRCAPPMP